MDEPTNQEVAALKARRDVAGLGRLMLDPDPWVRVEAADALAEIADPAAFDPLIDSIGRPCEGLHGDRGRGAAALAMSKLGRPTSAQLRRLVDMGGSGPTEAIALIQQHGMRDDPEVGLWYRAATGDWEGADASRPEAMALILENLSPLKYMFAAIDGLGAAGAAGVPHLVAILDRERPDERDAFGGSPKKNAYHVLCRIDAPAAREAAAAHFARMRAGADDKTERCRDGVVVAGGEPALRALLAELEDERPPRRAAAAHALGALGDERALPALEAALHDPYCKVTVLESAPDTITDDFLRESMQRTREDHPVRDAAAAAIARIRDGSSG